MQNTLVNIDFSRHELTCIRRALEVCTPPTDCNLDQKSIKRCLDNIQRYIDNSSIFAETINCTFDYNDISLYIQSIDYYKQGVISYNNKGHVGAISVDELQAIIDKFNMQHDMQANKISRMQS